MWSRSQKPLNDTCRLRNLAFTNPKIRSMEILLHEKKININISLLNDGHEKGLNFFYKKYFSYLLSWAHRATKDECAAESITQEAMLRLWLFRENVESLQCIQDFLHGQLKEAIKTYYNKSNNRFHRSLLQLDGIEDYQEFMLGYELEEEEEEDVVYLEKLEDEKKKQLNKLNNILPNLQEEQQLFIRLCLRYSFNYDRIAFYLGGISDYEVGLRVEKTIEALKAIFNSSEKLDLMNKPQKMVLQGEFDEAQAEVFHMRYELQLSFDEIAEALKLSGAQVRKLFVDAHATMRAAKKIA